jgi:hypothetical protein
MMTAAGELKVRSSNIRQALANQAFDKFARGWLMHTVKTLAGEGL